MTVTQQFINNWRFDHVIHTPLQFVTQEIKYFSLPKHSDHLVQTGIVLGLLTTFIILARLFFVIKNNLQRKAILLEITPPAFTEKTAYTTSQLFSVLHSVRYGNKVVNWILGKKNIFSFEIVSTREKGIRYLIRVSPEQKEIVKKMVSSYLPQSKVQEVTEYLSQDGKGLQTKIIEFTLKNRFAYPLEKQNVLNQHDPVAYITGMMTKLASNELISLQIVVSPKRTHEAPKIARMILRQEDVLAYLDRPAYPSIIAALVFTGRILSVVISKVCFELIGVINEVAHGSSKIPAYSYQYAAYQQNLQVTNAKPVRQLSVFEQEVIQSVQKKVDQPLFETAIRVLVQVKDTKDMWERVNGIKASLEPFSVPQYQSLHAKYNFPPGLIDWIRNKTFSHRLLSLIQNKSDSLLSVSEIADLYHFPYAKVTQTENIVKSYFKELPAPLSLKKGRDMEVVFGNNMYGETQTPIGLTEEERETHMFIIGRTGSGKTTMMFSMAKDDIQKGRGVSFIDPHGDVSEDLLSCIPDDRKDDLVYLNPIDLKYPIGINVLELTPGLDEDEAELEKEVVAEGVISLFRKVFSKEENTNAHRIEYILRNTIYTAFTLEDPTIFTIYDLLNDPEFRKKAVKNLEDENLKLFWKNEFGKAGDYQIIKMTGGVTAKIGRFLFSPTAKRILGQKHSTINFDEILNSGKILICNLSQGKLGEDTSRVLGITILTKLQQAALKRANIPEEKRRPFYLYVDEFQNFATQSFSKMMSEGRKYKLRLIIAEQSTSQQDYGRIINIILANVTTVVVFRSANPIDEEFMLAQFSPYIQKGDIANLPRYHFYIKVSALDPEEPFSGQTIYVPIMKDEKKMEKLIAVSRKNYAVEYKMINNGSGKKIDTKTKPEVQKEIKTELDAYGLPKING